MVWKESEIPDIVIRRLPVYARTLDYLLQEGITTISSSDLGERIDVTAAQIRRDLSYFGDFGKQGKGYNVQFLLNQIRDILNLGKHWSVALVGIGPLGQAIAHYGGFRDKGFDICALFDADPRKVGMLVDDLEVQDVAQMSAAIRRDNIRVAIVAVPAHHAQDVVDMLVDGGVKAILNYAPITVMVPDDVRVRHIDPVAALQSMTFYLLPEEAKRR